MPLRQTDSPCRLFIIQRYCMSDHESDDKMEYLHKQNFVAMGLYF